MQSSIIDKPPVWLAVISCYNMTQKSYVTKIQSLLPNIDKGYYFCKLFPLVLLKFNYNITIKVKLSYFSQVIKYLDPVYNFTLLITFYKSIYLFYLITHYDSKTITQLKIIL